MATRGRIDNGHGPPGVGERIIPTAVVQIQQRAAAAAAPDDHFAPGPGCRMTAAGRRRALDRHDPPGIACRIISEPGIESDIPGADSAPDNHFASGPDGGVAGAWRGRDGSY